MNRRLEACAVACVVAMICLAAFGAAALAAEETQKLQALAIQATGEDAGVARSAITQLRAAGPAGLAALIDANAELVRKHRAGAVDGTNDPQWNRVAAAIDTVAAQKDAWASGLYWYTDLEAAKRAARESGKPILSLRLLGTLDTEFSCANSRFFRTVLYANSEVSHALSDRFVLHWKSVRPVPKVTIDFGDGRVVERTITGNSIHFVLDPEGRVIDGIPGLYGPKAFLQQLNAATGHAPYSGPRQSDDDHRAWHRSENGRVLALWQEDLRRVGAGGVDSNIPVQRAAPVARPSAVAAAPSTVWKNRVELRLVQAILPDAKGLENASTAEVWTRIAALHAEDSRLDGTSRALMAAKNPAALQAGRLAITKSFVESPLVKIVQNFERSISEDTVRNEYLFHRQIHAWLAEGKLPDGKPASDVDSLNERVYADLFLTPGSDPWLGLLPANTYSALPDDGLCKAK
jgi:hypothetical protein